MSTKRRFFERIYAYRLGLEASSLPLYHFVNKRFITSLGGRSASLANLGAAIAILQSASIAPNLLVSAGT